MKKPFKKQFEYQLKFKSVERLTDYLLYAHTFNRARILTIERFLLNKYGKEWQKFYNKEAFGKKVKK
jgi:hypothetical protein